VLTSDFDVLPDRHQRGGVCPKPGS
jgi:hypothetical protein